MDTSTQGNTACGPLRNPGSIPGSSTMWKEMTEAEKRVLAFLYTFIVTVEIIGLPAMWAALYRL